MGENYNLDELIFTAIEQFEEGDENPEEYFKIGNVLEVLTPEGKTQIKSSIIKGVEINLAEAKDRARKLLVERNIVSQVQRYFTLNSDDDKKYSQRTNDLQNEYQRAYDKVIAFENYLSIVKE